MWAITRSTIPRCRGDDRGYTAFFDVERDLLATHPIAPVFGNHESVDTTFFDGLLSAPTFAGQPHPYYFSFDWGQVHIACLDSFEGPTDLLLGGARRPEVTDEQAQWLDADLAAAKGQGKQLFIMIHQGAFSHGIGSAPHGGLADVQNKIVPLMTKHGVLAMFAGHDHYYQRGHEGCIDYVVTGAGGAEMYEPDPNAPGVVKTFQDVSYVAVTVDTTGVASAETKDALGNVIDQFILRPASCTTDDPDAGPPADAAGDATPPPDAAQHDDSATPAADASGSDGSGSDAGVPSTDGGPAGMGVDQAGNDGGCACSAAGGNSRGALGLSVGALLAAFAVRRRRR